MQINFKFKRPTLRSSTVFTLSAAIVTCVFDRKYFLESCSRDDSYLRTMFKCETIFKWLFQVLLRRASPFLVRRSTCRADNIYAPLASPPWENSWRVLSSFLPLHAALQINGIWPWDRRALIGWRMPHSLGVVELCWQERETRGLWLAEPETWGVRDVLSVL